MKTILITLLVFSSLAFAGKKPPEDAPKRDTECEKAAQEYTHGALVYFHSMLCVLNNQFPGMAEEFLFRLVTKFGMSPDTTTLAADGTPTSLPGVTVDGRAIAASVRKVVAPDTFAGTYDFKAVITEDGTERAALYWSGKGSSSKGFFIARLPKFHADQPMGLLYIQWDRTTADQTIRVLGTRISAGSTYLANVRQGDRAMFGSVDFNETTKATTLYMTSIEAQRGTASTTKACFKMAAKGTIGGDVVVMKTRDSMSQTGHASTDTTQDGIVDMDQATLVDAVATANGTGNSPTVTPANAVVQNYSCDDIDKLGGAGKAFAGDAVNLTITKTEADALFGSN